MSKTINNLLLLVLILTIAYIAAGIGQKSVELNHQLDTQRIIIEQNLKQM